MHAPARAVPFLPDPRHQTHGPLGRGLPPVAGAGSHPSAAPTRGGAMAVAGHHTVWAVNRMQRGQMS